MFCRFCGKEISPSAKFCKYCGKPIPSQEANPQANNAENPLSGEIDYHESQNKSAFYSNRSNEAPPAFEPAENDENVSANASASKKWVVVLVALVVIAVLAVLAVGAFLFIKGKDKTDDSSSSTSRKSTSIHEEEPPDDSESYDDLPDESEVSSSIADSDSPDSTAEVVTAPEHQQEIHVVSSGSSATLTLLTWKDGEWITNMSTTAAIGSNGVTENKIEGDKCTPAGTFNVLFCFGLSQPDTALSFYSINQDSVWVCDNNSKYYNTLQSASKSDKDWTSIENLYKKFSNKRSNYCIYFDFNGDGLTSSIANNGGADLFIDGVSSSGKMYSGYGDIKITEDAMIELLSYMDSNLKPIIVIE